MHLNHSLPRGCDQTGLQFARAGQCHGRRELCQSHESSGRLYVTTGPGGTNAVTGVGGGMVGLDAMLVISGQVKSQDRMFDKDGCHWACANLGCGSGHSLDRKSRLRNMLSRFSIRATFVTIWRRPSILPSTAVPVRCWIDIHLDVQPHRLNCPLRCAALILRIDKASC